VSLFGLVSDLDFGQKPEQCFGVLVERFRSAVDARRPRSPPGADVVGLVVGVHQVGHLVGHAVVGADLVDGPLQVVPDGRGRVEQHHAVAGGEERRLVGAVGDPVQVPLHPANEVILLVDGGAEGRRGDGREVGQGRVGGGAGRGRPGQRVTDHRRAGGDGGQRSAAGEQRSTARGRVGQGHGRLP
jgi:hypothetical protein